MGDDKTTESVWPRMKLSRSCQGNRDYEDQARELIRLIGTDRNPVLREARLPLRQRLLNLQSCSLSGHLLLSLAVISLRSRTFCRLKSRAIQRSDNHHLGTNWYEPGYSGLSFDRGPG